MMELTTWGSEKGFSQHQESACTKILRITSNIPMQTCLIIHQMKISKVSDYEPSKNKNPRAYYTHENRKV